MTANEVRELLKDHIGLGTITDWCAANDCKLSGTSQFLLGDLTKPPERVLKALGLRVDYAKITGAPNSLHPSHKTRFSDASSFDEICINCGATDIAGGGWGRLAEPCRARLKGAVNEQAL